MAKGVATRPKEWALFADAKDKTAKVIPKRWPSGRGGARFGAGRKQIEIPLNVLEAVASSHATLDEIAAYFHVTADTISRRQREDPEFREALNRGRALGKFNIRYNQTRMAQHHPGMAIWLGKQYLGQKDQIEQSGQIDHAMSAEMIAEIGKGFVEYLDYFRKLRRGPQQPVIEAKAEER